MRRFPLFGPLYSTLNKSLVDARISSIQEVGTENGLPSGTMTVWKLKTTGRLGCSDPKLLEDDGDHQVTKLTLHKDAEKLLSDKNQEVERT